MKISNILNHGRVISLATLGKILIKKRIVLLRYNDKKTAPIFDFISKIKKDREMWVTHNEAYQIFMGVNNTKNIKGDIAEVGVYKGGTAKVIAMAKGPKKLYLFDTFEGLPKRTEHDNEELHKGLFHVEFEEVKKYLQGEKEVYFYKGLFPKTAKPIENVMFSFVHLDVDLYESTLDCLKFFYPRMSKGGIIISHDYQNLNGVRKAFDEFFEKKLEPIIEMSGSQCLVIKL